MSIRYFAFVFCLAGFGFSHAQTQEDFDDAGKRILSMVTDSAVTQIVHYIRKPQYFELVDRQPISDYQKTLLKEKLNDDYSKDHSVMENALAGLRASYAIERKEGATFEYYETLNEPLRNSTDTYAVKTNYIYRNGKVQTIVSFEYELAWLGDHFALISEIRESF